MTARPRPPVWLAVPGRLSRAGPAMAAGALALLALLLLASLGALTLAAAPQAANVGDQTDLGLYAAIVDGLRGGGDYYSVAVDALRAGGYPLRPFATVRLPTLAVVQATLSDQVTVALLYALAAAVAAMWFMRLRVMLARPPAIVAALFLLAGGMLAFVQPGLIRFHEVWAGLLVALSLGLYRSDRWIESAAIALAAMMIRETAALYAIAMALVALTERRRREAIGWGVVLAILALVVAVHAHAVARATNPLDPASAGWAGLHGFGLFAKAMAQSTSLALVPLWLAAPVVAMALFGWATCPGGLALRATATFVAYAAAIALFARVDTFYWVLVVAPLFLVGLAFVPDGLRDAARALLDRRRVRVHRITR